MEVDERFAPLRSDADCTIQPQSLIGEKFVQCTPGTPRGRRAARRSPDTVPRRATRTRRSTSTSSSRAPRAPMPERLSLVIDELGGGLAGRGGGPQRRDPPRQPGAAAHAARPAHPRPRPRQAARADRRGRARPRRAGRPQATRSRVIDRGAPTSRAAAAGAGATSGARSRTCPHARCARPARAARPAPLAATASRCSPTCSGAAPALRRLAGDVGPLADAARPALDRLGRAAADGRADRCRGRRRSSPSCARSRARPSRPARWSTSSSESLRDRGVVEGLQDFATTRALATARFDRYSHIIPAHLLGSECSAVRDARR